jgi:hypothetical protein
LQEGGKGHQSVEDCLKESRRRYAKEMNRAIMCRTKVQKLQLVQDWKRDYPPLVVKELIACAKDKVVMAAISNWDVNNWGKK